MCLDGAGAWLSSNMGALSTGLQVAGAVSGVIGSYRKSQAEKQAYEYQSKVAANNAALAETQARDAIARGQTEEANQRLKAAQLKGTQRASLAARGISLDEGSAANILADTDYMGEIDALTIRDNAAREAWGRRVQASNYASDSSMLQSRADAESPGRAAFGSLLTGATAVASTWYDRSKNKR